METVKNRSTAEGRPPSLWNASNLITILIGVLIGTALALLVLPQWLPAMRDSLLNVTPHIYWYLSRASAFVSYIFLWLSMVFGLLITNRLARLWPGGPGAFDLHEYTSLMGLGFGLFHALILIGDQYMNSSLAQLLIPFANTTYQPFWVGIGQLSFYLLAIVSFSFYVRRWIGQRTWRVLHWLSFLLFGTALLHGVMSGSDTGNLWVQLLYWGSAFSVIFLTIYRVLVTIDAKQTRALRQADPTPPQQIGVPKA